MTGESAEGDVGIEVDLAVYIIRHGRSHGA